MALTEQQLQDNWVTISALSLVLSLPENSFHFCPVSGKVLWGVTSDDKVLCPCGKTNPILVRRGVRESAPFQESAPYGYRWHVKHFLLPATADDYISQTVKEEEADGMSAT